jgi:hypothetical protein
MSESQTLKTSHRGKHNYIQFPAVGPSLIIMEVLYLKIRSIYLSQHCNDISPESNGCSQSASSESPQNHQKHPLLSSEQVASEKVKASEPKPGWSQEKP